MPTTYPGALDTFTTKQDGEDKIIYAAHVNDLQDSVLAIETELGTDPAGSAADLKTRLAIMLTDAGGFKGPGQVKIVAKAHGEYTTIQSAINAIADATAAKPYVVLIFPGVYDEKVTCKDHVNLLGLSPRSCKIDTTQNRGIEVATNINAFISNLYIRSRFTNGFSLRIGNGTVHIFNCIIEGDADNYALQVAAGILHARNCQIIGNYYYTLTENANSTYRHCTFTSSGLGAVIVLAGDPQFYFCELHAGGNSPAIWLNLNTCNPRIAYCILVKSGAATESVHAEQANTDAQIYHCSMNAALDGDVDNLIGTPYNVIDADLT